MKGGVRVQFFGGGSYYIYCKGWKQAIKYCADEYQGYKIVRRRVRWHAASGWVRVTIVLRALSGGESHDGV